MPYKVALSGVRGDAFMAAIPLTYPGPPVRPLTDAEAVAIRAAYPVIEMQVRAQPTDTGAPLLSLTALAGQLGIQTGYPQPDGTTAPVLLIQADSTLTQALINGVYDIQFSGPGVGPYTWVGGTFKLSQDVTRASG